MSKELEKSYFGVLANQAAKIGQVLERLPQFSSNLGTDQGPEGLNFQEVYLQARLSRIARVGQIRRAIRTKTIPTLQGMQDDLVDLIKNIYIQTRQSFTVIEEMAKGGDLSFEELSLATQELAGLEKDAAPIIHLINPTTELKLAEITKPTITEPVLVEESESRRLVREFIEQVDNDRGFTNKEREVLKAWFELWEKGSVDSELLAGKLWPDLPFATSQPKLHYRIWAVRRKLSKQETGFDFLHVPAKKGGKSAYDLRPQSIRTEPVAVPIVELQSEPDEESSKKSKLDIFLERLEQGPVTSRELDSLCCAEEDSSLSKRLLINRRGRFLNLLKHRLVVEGRGRTLVRGEVYGRETGNHWAVYSIGTKVAVEDPSEVTPPSIEAVGSLEITSIPVIQPEEVEYVPYKRPEETIRTSLETALLDFVFKGLSRSERLYLDRMEEALAPYLVKMKSSGDYVIIKLTLAGVIKLFEDGCRKIAAEKLPKIWENLSSEERNTHQVLDRLQQNPNINKRHRASSQAFEKYIKGRIGHMFKEAKILREGK